MIQKPGSLPAQIEKYFAAPTDFPLEFTAWLRNFITEPTNYQGQNPAAAASSAGVFFNIANTALASRFLNVTANHNGLIAFPYNSPATNRPGIALVSSDSYGVLIQASSSAAQVRLVADGTRVQLQDTVNGYFLVEKVGPPGVTRFEVDANGTVWLPFLTAAGDLMFANSSGGDLVRLGVGSTNQMLSVTGGFPAWKPSPTSVLTTTGDSLYASAANTLARRAIGSTGNVYTVAGGVPTWAAPSNSFTNIVTAPAASSASTLALGTAYQNLLGYDVMLMVNLNITVNTTGVIQLGVGPTSTPTQQTIATGVTSTGFLPVPIMLPNNYYALLSTSGTITVTIAGQIAMPV